MFITWFKYDFWTLHLLEIIYGGNHSKTKLFIIQGLGLGFGLTSRQTLILMPTENSEIIQNSLCVNKTFCYKIVFCLVTFKKKLHGKIYPFLFQMLKASTILFSILYPARTVTQSGSVAIFGDILGQQKFWLWKQLLCYHWLSREWWSGERRWSGDFDDLSV